jgi:CRP/FNR family cyclic AMP-dependent transcriptional regulator
MMMRSAMQSCWGRSEVALIHDLSEQEVASIAAQAPIQTVDASTVVYSPQQPAELVFLLQEGRVHLFHHPCGGKTLTIAILFPGTIFGEMALLSQPTYDQFAVALDRCAISSMRRDDARQVLLGDPRLAARVADILGKRLVVMEHRLRDVACKTVPQRVAGTLLTYYRSAPADARCGQGSDEICITHEQLATLVVSYRETVTKVLDDLCRRRLIALKRRTIVLLDLPALAALATGS